MAENLLEIRNLSKTFPGVRALDSVSLTVREGEILALLGHNGSGKSTLVKVLAGVHRPDDGATITVPGTAGGSEHSGLHFIHQDLGLVPMLSALENIDLGQSLKGRAFRRAPVKQERARAHELITEFGADFDVTAPVATLTPAERTVVAIARALNDWTSPRNVLVLDEPTAALHGEEVEKLFAAVRRVAARGAGIIFISHRLEEVIEIADSVIILRNGVVAADQTKGNFDHQSLVDVIAGEGHTDAQDRAATAGGDVRLSVRDLQGPELHGISLDVRAGEIVGISGLLGSGSETLASCVYGGTRRTGGNVSIDGVSVEAHSPAAAIKAGAALVPADRRRHGAIVTMSARENLTLPLLRPLRRATGRLDTKAERNEAQRWMNDVEVLPADGVDRPFALFSGGNQQKIVLAKWLRNTPRVLLLEEPTQGVDVGAQASIYALISRAARSGAAVLVSSSDTEELAAICDRVLVLRDGRVHVELSGAELTEANLVRANLSQAPAHAPAQASRAVHIGEAS